MDALQAAYATSDSDDDEKREEEEKGTDADNDNDAAGPSRPHESDAYRVDAVGTGVAAAGPSRPHESDAYRVDAVNPGQGDVSGSGPPPGYTYEEWRRAWEEYYASQGYPAGAADDQPDQDGAKKRKRGADPGGGGGDDTTGGGVAPAPEEDDVSAIMASIGAPVVEVCAEDLLAGGQWRSRMDLTSSAEVGSVAVPAKPKGLERRKHQIGSLFAEYQHNERLMQEQKARGIKTKRETYAKYGW